MILTSVKIQIPIKIEKKKTRATLQISAYGRKLREDKCAVGKCYDIEDQIIEFICLSCTMKLLFERLLPN